MDGSIKSPPLHKGELVEIRVDDRGYKGWIRATYMGHNPALPLPYQFKPIEEMPPVEYWGFTQLLENKNWRRLPN